MAALYCLVAAVVLTREMGIVDLPSVMRGSGEIMGLIGPLVVFSIQFQQVLGVMGFTDNMQSWIKSIGQNYTIYAAVGLMQILLLVAGSLIESVAVVLIFAPVLAPVAVGLGIDPISWGVIFVLGTSVGFVTPPYGLNLFIISAVAKVKYQDVVRSIWPWIGVLIAGWLLWVVILMGK